MRTRLVALREDVAQGGGHHLLSDLGHGGQGVAHDRHAYLPNRVADAVARARSELEDALQAFDEGKLGYEPPISREVGLSRCGEETARHVVVHVVIQASIGSRNVFLSAGLEKLAKMVTPESPSNPGRFT
jgi:hypothetical protein